MRRTSPPNVEVCFACTHFQLSLRRSVWLRTSEGTGSFSPEKLVKLIAGMPKVRGAVETPVIPRSPATLFTLELSLSTCARLRLQFSCMVSTKRDVQLCDSPKVTDWLSVDCVPAVSGKLPNVFWRWELRL